MLVDKSKTLDLGRDDGGSFTFASTTTFTPAKGRDGSRQTACDTSTQKTSQAGDDRSD